MQHQPEIRESRNPRILVVDDQQAVRESLILLLEASGFDAVEASGGNAALRTLRSAPFDALLTDLKMEDMDGIELLKEIQKIGCKLPVIMITAYGSIQSAVEAMRIGAFDYITKPYDQDLLVSKLNQALEHKGHGISGATLVQRPLSATDYIVASPIMRRLLPKAIQAAKTNLNVLITGETGTGKTLLARIMHENSSRQNGPFVTINCASLPEHLLESELFGHVRGSFTGALKDRSGLFEAAHGGTAFLDEIGSMSLNLQAKLLGVLQDSVIRRVGSNDGRAIDVRVISATSVATAECHRPDASLREDLYYRLNGIRLHLPPLRDRVQDIAVLAESFLRQFSSQYGRHLVAYEDDAMSLLCSYPFPGNVRQLENLIEQVVAFAEPEAKLVTVQDLPDDVLEPQRIVAAHPTIEDTQATGATLALRERGTILGALQRNNHNLTQTAKLLGISRTTLWRKLRRYGVALPHR